MNRSRRWVLAGGLALTVAAVAVVSVTAASGRGTKKKPIIIGAAVDLTGLMKPFDSPELAAAKLQVKKINAAGGLLGGRKLQIKVCNHQGKNQKACAAQLIAAGAKIALVTCDV